MTKIPRSSTPVACDSSRIFPSISIFSSFFLLGVFMSALGPSIPAMSRDIGVPEESFGAIISLRGMGYLLGSWLSSLTVTTCGKERLWRTLNNRMYRLGAATAGIGGFSLLLGVKVSFWSGCFCCFGQGFCGGGIDAISNSAIGYVHGTDVAPWMQGLHFCFSAGAFFAPAVVAQLGYTAMFLTFGLLSMISALACCLSDGGGICACGRDEEGRGWERHPLELEGPSPSAENGSYGADLDRVEGAVQKMAPPERLADGPGTADVEEETNEKKRTRPKPSIFSKTGSVPTQQQERELTEDSPLTPTPGREERSPTLSMVALLVTFFLLYVGAEVGFGAWIAVVVLREGLAGKAFAASMASLFWGGITMGRLLAIPLVVRFSTASLLWVNLIGSLASSSLLLTAGKGDVLWAAVGAGLFGLFMASTYPLAMSLLPSSGYTLSVKNSSRMVVGGALGEMLVPAFIAVLLGSAGGGWPGVLYATCVGISALLIVLYCAFDIVLSAAKR